MAYILVHPAGMPIDPDGWAAWQGAISILSGQGYTYFFGSPVTAWPPLYSIYLASWTWLLGPTGWSLIVSNGVLIVLQAVLWMRLAMVIAEGASDALPKLPVFVTAAFLGVFVSLHQRDVLSQNLTYLLLPIYLEAIWRFVRPPDRDSARGLLPLGLIGFIGGLLWLSHNAAVVFVVAAAFVVWLRQPRAMRSVLEAGAIVVVPALIWGGLRLGLGQGQSHRFGFGAGTYGLMEYLEQLMVGIGRMFVPDRAGLSWITAICLLGLVFLVSRRASAGGLRFALLMTLVAIVFLVSLFLVTAVASPLTSTRQILFIGLILAPISAVSAAFAYPRMVCAVIVLLAIPQLYWIGLYATGRQFDSRPLTQPGHTTEWLVPARAYISREYRHGPPVETAKGLLIAPIAFEEGRR